MQQVSTIVQEACLMVVKSSQAARGHDGEQLHVRGPHMERYGLAWMSLDAPVADIPAM